MGGRVHPQGNGLASVLARQDRPCLDLRYCTHLVAAGNYFYVVEFIALNITYPSVL